MIRLEIISGCPLSAVRIRYMLKHARKQVDGKAIKLSKRGHIPESSSTKNLLHYPTLFLHRMR